MVTFRSQIGAAQVEIAQRYLAKAASRENCVSQLLMGEGKTTVVLPMLSLVLSSIGLVLTVVPPLVVLREV